MPAVDPYDRVNRNRALETSFSNADDAHWMFNPTLQVSDTSMQNAFMGAYIAFDGAQQHSPLHLPDLVFQTPSPSRDNLTLISTMFALDVPNDLESPFHLPSAASTPYYPEDPNTPPLPPTGTRTQTTISHPPLPFDTAAL
ncbi:hypothetical protein C8J57DRAFT_1233992 [Mycena rebaudengoi]|nr:hypothetical protein C8J57DRAFT_1233992 [Mycena rebaudengoi]